MSVKDEKRDAANYQPELGGLDVETVVVVDGGIDVNAAGYKDQLKRQYGLWGIAGVALTVDNAWAALGSSISVSIRKSARSILLLHPVRLFVPRSP
ncbi:hypothetical protein ONZ43_g3831 [Nemania bipapillata]|uniref:Uncharacterized protein n=1 Tax=Nemania bipapillata TaxID=110536 RepID=A0ACC2IVP6_9PEZI|nr:hypothetical protein ONZ43_g3831 [Nemania bipapillata]